jgi:hypothetical protein
MPFRQRPPSPFFQELVWIAERSRLSAFASLPRLLLRIDGESCQRVQYRQRPLASDNPVFCQMSPGLPLRFTGRFQSCVFGDDLSRGTLANRLQFGQPGSADRRPPGSLPGPSNKERIDRELIFHAALMVLPYVTPGSMRKIARLRIVRTFRHQEMNKNMEEHVVFLLR